MSAARKQYTLNNSPRTAINGFSDSAIVGNLLFQWGQTVSTVDGTQTFKYRKKHSSRVHSMLNNVSFKNVKSCLPIGAWSQSDFKVNRANAISGQIPFYWVSVGEAPNGKGSDDRPNGHRMLESDEPIKIAWGKPSNATDGTATYKMDTTFDDDNLAVFTCPASSDARWDFAVKDVSGPSKQFKINRANGINGKHLFHYLALGYEKGKSPNDWEPGVYGSDEDNGLLLQWGKATSTSDFEEVFRLHTAFADMNFSVITTMIGDNMGYGLSLTRPVNTRSFIVDRDGSVNGKRSFYWLAIGRKPKA